MAIISGPNIFLKLRDPHRVTSVIPKRSKIVTVQGQQFVMVRHGVEEVKILENLGLKGIPQPILNTHRYDWPIHHTRTPLPHQKQTAAFLTKHHRGWVLNEPRTMKTLSSLWAADFLMREGLVRKCLIVSTLSTLNDVWAKHIFDNLHYREFAILHGSKAQRLKALAQKVDFFIINHDGLHIVEKEIRERGDVDLIIYDEATAIKRQKTRRFTALKGVLTPATRFWPMTGTPVPKDPTDPWAVCTLVDPSRVPKYFTRFKEMTMTQITQYKWVAKPDAHKVVFDAMQPAIRIKKRDVLKDLPPLVFEFRQVELTDGQKKAYKQMHNDFVMQSRSGEVISAVNAADKMSKLVQIACGVVKVASDSDEYTALDYKHRLDALKECIDEAGGKVFVLVPFKGILRDLVSNLSEYGAEFINGDVPKAKRSEILQRFEHDPECNVLLAHPQVVAHGIELGFCSTTVWYGPTAFPEHYQQANERMASARQKNNMAIIELWAIPREKQLYEGLKKGVSFQEMALEMYKQEISG